MGAGEKWNSINLISSMEWRAFFRSMGYLVSSYYQHRATKRERYAYASMTIKPKDGHQVVQDETALLTEYMYEFIEKRLGKTRDDLRIMVQSYPWSAAAGHEHRPGMNQIDVTIVPTESLPYAAEYSTTHPLYGWR